MDNVLEKGDLRAQLAANPGMIIEAMAKDVGVSLRQAVEALPDTMRRFAPAGTFVEAMSDLAEWGDVTVILHTDDGVVEFSGPIPPGTVAQGYYNLAGRTGFHGHLRHERCGGIAFVERPLFGRPSASILFFNIDGGIMFKVFVGRDERRELLALQLAAFRALADRLCSPS